MDSSTSWGLEKVLWVHDSVWRSLTSKHSITSSSSEKPKSSWILSASCSHTSGRQPLRDVQHGLPFPNNSWRNERTVMQMDKAPARPQAGRPLLDRVQIRPPGRHVVSNLGDVGACLCCRVLEALHQTYVMSIVSRRTKRRFWLAVLAVHIHQTKVHIHQTKVQGTHRPMP